MTVEVRWLLAALACFRLAQFVVIDNGPWRICDRLREWAGCYVYDENGDPASELGRTLSCPFCVGLYTAPVFVVLALWPSLASDVILGTLGIAGIQSWLQRPRAWKRKE